MTNTAVVNMDVRIPKFWDEDVFEQEDIEAKELAKIVINSEGLVALTNVGVGCVYEGIVDVKSVKEEENDVSE